MLKAEHIDKSFGGVHALTDVTFEVAEGEVHALVGENGAGKSTLGKIIAGVLRPDEGTITFHGEAVLIESPLDAQRLGISMIFQELDLFPNLTVGENIVIGNLQVEKGRLVDFAELEAFCSPWLEQVGLTCPANTILGRLPVGEMQLVAIARALSMQTRLIVMDEATSSLSDEAVANLFDVIRRLKDSGVSTIYVSHKMDEVFDISDRITVLRDGSYVGTTATAETDKDELIRYMVGRDLSGMERRTASSAGEPLLNVEGLSTDTLHDISFELRRGDILGLAGLVGAGRSELGAALAGLDKRRGGQIFLNGKPSAPRSPRRAMEEGIALLPEDRKAQGLMINMGVRENASLSVLHRLQTLGVVNKREERENVRPVFRRTLLKAPNENAPVHTLSGGNQQKVLLAKCLLVNAGVLFLDEPCRGIDVGAKEDIYGIIEEQAQEGKGIIFVSSELPELLRCCDRIMVFCEGRNMGILRAAETTQEEIMALATGHAARL